MKAVIWDFDNTLAYNHGKWSGTLIRLINKYYPDIQLTREEIRPFFSQGFRWDNHNKQYTPDVSADEWWEEIYPNIYTALTHVAGIDVSMAKKLTMEFREMYVANEGWFLYDDSLSTLKTLTDNGWKHFILTNHVPELPQIIQYLQLDKYVEKVFNSAHTGYEKPHPQAFRNVLDFIGSSSKVWMVGDSYEADIIGARMVGIPSILVRRPHDEADLYAEELSQVIPLILSDVNA